MGRQNVEQRRIRREIADKKTIIKRLQTEINVLNDKFYFIENNKVAVKGKVKLYRTHIKSKSC